MKEKVTPRAKPNGLKNGKAINTSTDVEKESLTGNEITMSDDSNPRNGFNDISKSILKKCSLGNGIDFQNRYFSLLIVYKYRIGAYDPI